MRRIHLIEVKQPIGSFYISCLPADILLSITETVRREYDPLLMTTKGGVQRILSPKRVKEIASYTEDPDATFPTPIIIAVKQSANYTLENDSLLFDENQKLGEIIDGQHRIEGLRLSNNRNEFELPVILMFDLVEDEKAYVFSIINSKQTQVSKSLIYELFLLSEKRSPQKTCHEIARLFNAEEQSPFHKRLKMLGKKEHQESSLSQGSFVRYLLPLISKKPDQDLIDIKKGKKLQDDPTLPFRYYFIMNEDNSIYKLLYNYFKAVQEVFYDEWNDSSRYILSKTTGYGAMMSAFTRLYNLGDASNDLTVDFFVTKMRLFKQRLIDENLSLTSTDFPSNEQQQKRLAAYIIGE